MEACLSVIVHLLENISKRSMIEQKSFAANEKRKSNEPWMAWI